MRRPHAERGNIMRAENDGRTSVALIALILIEAEPVLVVYPLLF